MENKMETKIGLQLYSLRQQCNENLERVFAALSNTGYDGVEFHSFYDLAANDLKKLLDKYCLKPIGTHTGLEGLQTSLDDLIRYSTTIGSKDVTLAYYNSDHRDDWLRLCAVLESVGEKLRGYGLNLLYHNHAHEFIANLDGERPIDLILKLTSPQNLSLELDCYWVKYAGMDPEHYLKNNLGRVKTVHLKDMEKNKRKMTEVGTGIIDYAGIYKICAEADFEWVIIEQDDIEIDPWQSIKISLENVKKFRQRNLGWNPLDNGG